MLALAAVLSVTAHSTSTTAQVVRAWSAALNANRNADAAALFARNAEIVQGPLDAQLTSTKLAVAFNASLPCAG